jgi:ATP synthase protein I
LSCGNASKGYEALYKGGKNVMGKTVVDGTIPEPLLDLESSVKNSVDSLDDYVKLQLRIFRLAAFVTLFVVITAFFFFGFQASISILIGALSGILYLRLLARGIGKLGKASKMVGKIQLLVPVLLVLVVSKLPQLDLLPALLGFLLYKPSLIIQFLLEPSAIASSE